MTLPNAPAPTGAAMLLAILLICFVPFAAAGLALINTGLGRSRSAAHVMLASMCAMGIAALVYLVCGFSWQGFAGGPAHVAMVDGKPWNWLAAEAPFFRGMKFNGSPAPLAAWLGMLSAGVAALIPLGSATDRWRLGAVCGSTALLAGCTYPLFAHWAWGGGWLAQLGANYGLGHGFIDAGGSGAIQTLGGFTALAVVWIVGPRRGKFAMEGMPTAIPGHNAVLVLFGCLLALAGWLGLNGAGAILYAAADPGTVVLVGINTTLAAISGALATAAVTRIRFGRPDASLCANGWVGGLAASSAGCAMLAPAEAVFAGLVAGIAIPFAIELLEMRLAVDDPGGAISVHTVGGIWGLVAAGLFAPFPWQWLAQLVGVATLAGFVFPLAYGLNWLLDRIYPQRVAPEGERQGMDLYELGAGAYPEFLTRTEDFTLR